MNEYSHCAVKFILVIECGVAVPLGKFEFLVEASESGIGDAISSIGDERVVSIYKFRLIIVAAVFECVTVLVEYDPDGEYDSKCESLACSGVLCVSVWLTDSQCI